MFKRNKKIGLVLSSGAAKGVAHIGVIDYLLQNDYQIEYICGSSIGALVGAYLSIYKDIKGLKRIAIETDWKLLLGLMDINIINLYQGGIIAGKKIEEFLKEIFKDNTFQDCKIPLIIVATDLKTGKPIEIETGEIWQALRASIAIPGIFTPLKLQENTLIDGGVSMPMPSYYLKKRKVKNIIGVNVLSEPPQIFSQGKSEINIIENLLQSLFIMESTIANEQARLCRKTINPPVSHIPFYDFTRAIELIEIGYQTAQRSAI